ncbi:hypothetical protein HPB48_006085 [Haemaphysalis longicornis]|uniref:Uncharacterized protein n=1 Tax=Haemaphysalis longicornis TaxID=44386 RepID=A0A9J6GVX6_HAELO|nr:hypothetical protein HPB48_006085 [Haemaphysalis longicornis]
MFALVRFVQDADNRLHIIPVEDIVNFNPNNEDDFDSRITYSAYWHDDRGENNGVYVAQILKLAGGEKKRQNRAAAKKIQFQEVLREHLQHALEANTTVSKQAPSGKVCQTFRSAKVEVTKSLIFPQAKLRSQTVPQPGTDSVPYNLCIAEVPTASCSYNEKVYINSIMFDCACQWGLGYREKRPRLSPDSKHKLGLLPYFIGSASESTERSRISEETVATPTKPYCNFEGPYTVSRKNIGDAVDSICGSPRDPVNGHHNDVGSEDCHQADLGTPPNNQMEATSPPIEGAVNPGPDEEPAPFCATSDGRLYNLSAYNNLNSSSSACLAHWGKVKNSDTTVAASNVPRILSEKIQDVTKKLKLAKA